jgi:chromosome segregation protein
MRLKKIKLAGFKSFVDPTTLLFPSNLLGIVGPNGCGKSNIMDAVRWVMGEISAKHLRGDSMADVIFNGSSSRKPVGQASVELVFDNSDGRLGGQYAAYAEIAIRRQVGRDGQSQYYLNGSKCRRRDIADIFLGTGLGPRSYAIIEQGMVSKLVEARPEDLRAYLEEVAGISKYKERRKETESRMQHTRDNLSRLTDLRDELDKQLQHLQRQAKAAERYQELKAEERRLKGELLALRWRAFEAQAAARQTDVSARETALEGRVAAVRALEAQIEALRVAQTAAAEALNTAQGEYYQMGAQAARLEQSLEHLRQTRARQQAETEDTERQQAALQAHLAQDEAQLQAVRRQRAEGEPQLAEARLAESAARQALAEAEAALAARQQEAQDWQRAQQAAAQAAEVQRTRIAHLDRHVQQLQARRAAIQDERQALDPGGPRAELEALAGELAGAEGACGEQRALLAEAQRRIAARREQIEERRAELDAARREHNQMQGRLASLDTLQAAALGKNDQAAGGWLRQQGLAERARLGEDLQVEPGWERAVEVVLGDSLEAVLVEDMDAALAQLESLGAALLTLAAARAEAAAVVEGTLAAQVRGPAQALLAGVRTAPDLSAALAVRAALAEHESVVTPQGWWLSRQWVRVRQAQAQEGVVARGREIEQLRTALNEAQVQGRALETALQQAREQLEADEDARAEAQAALAAAERRGAEVRAELNARRQLLARIEERAARLAAEWQALEEQQAAEQAELTAARGALEQALESMAGLEGRRETLAAALETARGTVQQAREQLQRARDAGQQLAARLEALAGTEQALQQSAQRQAAQAAQLAQRAAALAAALAELEGPLAAQAAELPRLLEQRQAAELRLAEARRTAEGHEHELRQQTHARHAAEGAVEDARQALEDARLAWREVRVRCEGVTAQLAEMQLEATAVLQTLAADAQEAQWVEQIDGVERRIQRLGPINLAAIEEFKDKSERKQYLDAQHADLTQALETLEDAIRKIDRETRTLFKDTFDQVNSGFQQTFPRLFGGGHGYLELTGEEILETGVSVMARPPGKRNSTIHLLSGGEKALTAVALLLSFFQLNPAPFCMLDEIDAPLDDANVGRFCEVIREMSAEVQFIVVTHSKITMEMMNQLNGVTMQEPGVSRLVAVDVDEAVRLAAA